MTCRCCSCQCGTRDRGTGNLNYTQTVAERRNVLLALDLKLSMQARDWPLDSDMMSDLPPSIG